MSIIHPHIDTLLIKHLEIDDLRNLYQVNKYYHNLLKDILTNFIDFYSKIDTINLPEWIKDNKLFNKAIIFGKLNVCKYIHRKYDFDIHTNFDESFQIACIYGYLKIAQWLYSLGNFDTNCDKCYSFRYSCYNGYLDVAKWLHSLGINSKMAYDSAFRLCCNNNQIHVAKWLCSIDTRYHIQIANNKIIKYNIG